MRTPALVSLVAVLCLLGCSKAGSSRRLLPNTTAEVAASPDFKLDSTNK
jgi:hypothetical protein